MNKVILMGRLTADPTISYVTSENIPVCKFTLAVDRKFQKKGEEKQTDFITIVAWRSQAGFCSKYFTKGLRVLVMGSMQVRSWDDNDGKKRYATDVVIDEAYFADGKKNNTGGSMNQNFEMPPGYDEAIVDGNEDLPF